LLVRGAREEVETPSVGASVLVADDHYPTRERLRARLSAAGFRVWTASDADSAVRAAEAHAVDLCLIDINMPGGGIAAVGRTLAAAPAAIVVMLTVSNNEEDLFDALQAGASGYLLKDVGMSSLPDLLRRALDGEALLSGRLAARVVEEFRERGRRKRILATHAPGTELTRREWQVLELLAQNLTTAEIAERLFLEPVTIRTHIARILHKLQVPTRQAALRLLERRREPPIRW
jgi:DNA-binding NarL/FixJ family response regulator